MDSLNNLSSQIEPQAEIKKIAITELKIGEAYAIVKMKQSQTRYGVCTYAIIKVCDANETVNNRILFLPARLNKGFSPDTINMFNAKPESKFLKYLGFKKMYEGAKPTQLFQFGDL